MQFITHRVACFFLMTSIAANSFAEIRSIGDTVRIAVSNHPESLAKVSELLVQAEALTQAEAAFLPQISVGLGIGREDSNNTSTRAIQGGGSDEMERRESSLSLSQMLFDGFKTHWQRESEIDTLSAIEYELAFVAGQVSIRAIESHLDVARSNRVLNINIDNLRAHEQIAEDTHARARSGKDDWAKVSQINARLSLSLANVEAAKNEVMEANANYLMAVGEDSGREIFFQDQLYRMPETVSELLDDINHSNPQILSSMLDVKSAKASARAAKNTDFPSLFLESGATWDSNLDGVHGRNSDAYVMLRMRYDLYRGGADKAAKNKAMLLSERAGYKLDETRRQVRRDAENAWHSYQSNAKRVKHLTDYVEFAMSTKTAYEKQFNIGQRSLIDLLDAENELQRASRLLVDAQRDLYLSKYQILNLKGQLLAQLSVNMPSAEPRTLAPN